MPGRTHRELGLEIAGPGGVCCWGRCVCWPQGTVWGLVGRVLAQVTYRLRPYGPARHNGLSFSLFQPGNRAEVKAVREEKGVEVAIKRASGWRLRGRGNWRASRSGNA